MRDDAAPFSCQCGAVQGWLQRPAPSSGQRVVCYCKDCQAFAHYLNDDRPSLDANGGSDIFQSSSRDISIDRGLEHLRAIRLTGKGPVRWFADCCKSPIANTFPTPAIPLISMLTSNFDPVERAGALGPITGHVFADSAHGAPTTQPVNMGMWMVKLMGKMAAARMAGAHKNHPMFDPITKAPIAEPVMIPPADRAALHERLAGRRQQRDA